MLDVLLANFVNYTMAMTILVIVGYHTVQKYGDDHREQR